MKTRARPIPEQSQLHARLTGTAFHEAYAVNNPYPERPALALWIQTLGRAPGWIDAAMRARNAIVKRLGLKDLGGGLSDLDRARPLSDYRVGQRVGIFTLLHLSDDEVVMGDDDKHLDVQVSLLKTMSGGKPQAIVSTVVHLHNALGRAYMFFVAPAHRRTGAPAHRIIAPTVLSKI